MEVGAGAGAGAGGGRKSFGGAKKQQTRKRRRGSSKGPSGGSSGAGTADHVDKERVAKYMRGSRNTHRVWPLSVLAVLEWAAFMTLCATAAAEGGGQEAQGQHQAL